MHLNVKLSSDNQTMKSNLQHTDVSTPAITNADISTATATASELDHPSVLANIYQNAYSIVIWQRSLPSKLKLDVETIVSSDKPIQISQTITLQNCQSDLKEALQDFKNTQTLIEDITQLINLYFSLFELKQARLKLTTLDQVMCPRFHVDNVPCRLVTTYLGSGTQWLPHDSVDRSKLGKGSKGLPDELSGIYRNAEDIQQLTNGDVALLKGALWENSEHISLVHRSPTPRPGETRLFLTLDFTE